MPLWLIPLFILLLLLLLLLCSHLVLKVTLTDALRLKIGMLGIYVTVLSPEKTARALKALQQESPEKKKKREQKEQRKADKKRQKQQRKQARKVAAQSAKRRSRKQKLADATAAPPPKSFPETVSFVLEFLRALLPPVGKMLRHLKMTNLAIYISVGGQDAAKTALSFVKMSAAVHQTCALLASQMTVEIHEIDIRPNFCSEQTQQDLSFAVKIRPIRIIIGGVGILYNVIVLSAKQKQTAGNPPAKKSSPLSG